MAIKRINEQNAQFESINDSYERMYCEYDIQTIKNLLLGASMDRVEFSSQKIAKINQANSFILLTLVSDTPEMQNTLSKICVSFFNKHSASNSLVFDYFFSTRITFVLLYLLDANIASAECAKIAAQFEDSLRASGYCASIGISRPFYEITKLQRAFFDCVTALDNKPLSSSGGVFSYNEGRSYSFGKLSGKMNIHSSSIWIWEMSRM